MLLVQEAKCKSINTWLQVQKTAQINIEKGPFEEWSILRMVYLKIRSGMQGQCGEREKGGGGWGWGCFL